MAKIDKATCDAMAELIEPLDTRRARDIYIVGDFPRSHLVLDLDKRYRWDLFYAAKAHRVLPDDAGITDAHIDTALRTIVRPLHSEWK